MDHERLVPLYLKKPQPLRRAVVAKKLKTVAMNLSRAAKAATELGEDGISYVFLSSESNNPDSTEPIRMIADLQDWAVWSARAAETAQQMSVSDRDHKGGRTPDVRLRALVTILMDRYKFLLSIKATRVRAPRRWPWP